MLLVGERASLDMLGVVGVVPVKRSGVSLGTAAIEFHTNCLPYIVVENGYK